MPSINYQHFALQNKELAEDNRILERENEDMKCAMLMILRELSLQFPDDYPRIKDVVEKYWKWLKRSGD